MNNDTSSHDTPSTSPRRRWRRIAIATLLGGLVAGMGAKVFAQGGPVFGHHCGTHRMHGAGDFLDQSPEAMQQRIDAWVKWTLADVSATEAQQKQISAIAAAAAADLKPLRDKHHAVRASAAAALTQPTIDRTALEGLRVQELELADTVSRRLTQALGDAAEVLTPEQRAKLAEKVQHMKGRWS